MEVLNSQTTSLLKNNKASQTAQLCFHWTKQTEIHARVSNVHSELQFSHDDLEDPSTKIQDSRFHTDAVMQELAARPEAPFTNAASFYML